MRTLWLLGGSLWCLTAGCTSSVETDAGADEPVPAPDMGHDAGPLSDGGPGSPDGACARLDFAANDRIEPDRSCTVDSDCDQVPSRFACCPGALRWRGVSTSDEARFAAEIDACERGIGPADCG